jgi:opacity protein-like surface antigen
MLLGFSMKRLLIASAAALLCVPAWAADLYDPVPPPPPVVAFGGWYLRGDLGMTNQTYRGLNHELFADVDAHEFLDNGGFDSAPLGSLGVGYQFNQWLRADAIVQYRGNADFSALDRYGHWTPTGTAWDATNDYDGAKSEWLLMANAYVDVGNWNGVVPYVGAGIGASRNTISHFRDVNVPNAGVAYGDSASQWNFAWALHAGVGYEVTDRLTVDFGYSYVSLGDAKTGRLRTYDNTDDVAPMHFEGLASHDFKLGLRYSLQ